MPGSVETWTVRRLLEWTTAFFQRKGLDSPRLSAEWLLAHVLNVPRIKLFADYYARPLTDAELSTYRNLVQRAAEEEPIAYLTGKAHFFTLELEVNRDVLIPRPDTETLVEHVIQTARIQPGLEAPRVLDLCTGSGCIALAVAAELKAASVLGIDISPAAVAVARSNANRLKLSDRVAIEQGDLFEPLTRAVDPRPFDIVVANPPYIPSARIASLDRGVRDYEPISALDGGPDGLALHRRIIAQAPDRLVEGGPLYLEIAFDQGSAATALFAHSPQFTDVRLLKDIEGRDRVVTARRIRPT